MSGSAIKKEDGKFYISWEDYKKVHKDYKGTWDTPDCYPEYMGKRTLMVYDNGTCLVIEGVSLVIENAPKQRVRKEISNGKL